MPSWLLKRLHRFVARVLLKGDSRRAMFHTAFAARIVSFGLAQPAHRSPGKTF
jgi:hypothetical protein